jgi:hypothetical protein
LFETKAWYNEGDDAPNSGRVRIGLKALKDATCYDKNRVAKRLVKEANKAAKAEKIWRSEATDFQSDKTND